MNKISYIQLHTLLAEYKFELIDTLLSPYLNKEVRDKYEKLLDSIDELLKNIPVKSETDYSNIGVCANEN